MIYEKDNCLSGDYFECSDTSGAIAEFERLEHATPSHDLPLDTDSYHSIEEPFFDSTGDAIETLAFSLDTSHYKKSSVRKITYRVIKK